MSNLRRTPAPFALALALAASLLAPVVAAPPAAAVNALHDRVVSADPADWTPHVLNNKVRAIVQLGDRMIVGGGFANVAEASSPTTAIPRTNLFAFDAATGAIDTGFTPGLNGQVFALATDGTNVFVGGEFSRANRRDALRIVKLGPDGKTITSFSAAVTNGAGVYDLVLANGLLYMGGAFTEVNGQPRSGLAAVDPETGALAAVDVPFTGLHNGGVSRIAKLDVTPNGSTLVATGNFTTVAGQPRHQIALLDLQAATPAIDGTASLSSWATTRYDTQCATKFDTYIRDIDIDPTGTYFVVATTGAFFGGANAGVLCDTSSRWELGQSGSGQQPSWVAYAGGDTTWSIAATGAAVYVGGHFRWYNNPYAGDKVGPGTVKRRGIAALDPLNGLPLSWNPGRELGEGVFALVATPSGLWVGSDSEYIANEYHARLAFMPLAGGKVVPTHVPSTLPGDLVSLPSSACPSVDPRYLYRVNAAGPALESLDCGPAWAADDQSTNPLRTTGSNVATYNPVPNLNASVPASTPGAVFSTERWDPSTLPAMSWSFPVTTDTQVGVRLYFANRCSCTNKVGRRAFDVSIDGTLVLNDYDIVADTGNDTGTMKSFTITSDGTVNVDFAHVPTKDNPLVNAIELVDLGATGVSPATAEYLATRTFDGTVAGPRSTVATPGVDWATARGAWWTGNRVYYGTAEGKVFSRTYNGVTVGTPRQVFLKGLTSSYFPVALMTGAFFDDGRLYYTLRADDRLYMRYFTPESQTVGAQTFVVATPGGGFDWGSVRGMTLAGGAIYAARVDGSLTRIGWQPGSANGTPVPGSLTVISTDAGQAWASNGMFVRNP
jgi:hypothetical protein